jgi:hypothetical protein
LGQGGQVFGEAQRIEEAGLELVEVLRDFVFQDDPAVVVGLELDFEEDAFLGGKIGLGRCHINPFILVQAAAFQPHALARFHPLQVRVVRLRGRLDRLRIRGAAGQIVERSGEHPGLRFHGQRS